MASPLSDQPMPSSRPLRIVLSGGPGGGKTTSADLFRREIGDHVVVVPEAATILFQGGFPRAAQPSAQRHTQTAIFHVQRHLESEYDALYPGRVLLCDRGTIDGAAYWPDSEESYFASVQTTFEEELARYDAVIFFETAAVGGCSIEGGNPIRNETLDQAIVLDSKLRALWSRHPAFHLIPHQASFFGKISTGLETLQAIVSGLSHSAS
jgi:predicted ATPase